MLGLENLNYDNELNVHTAETNWFHKDETEENFYQWFKARTIQPLSFNPFPISDVEISHRVEMDYFASQTIIGGKEYVQWNISGDDPMLDRLKGSPRIELMCEHNEEERKYEVKLVEDRFASKLLLSSLLSDFDTWRNRKAFRKGKTKLGK